MKAIKILDKLMRAENWDDYYPSKNQCNEAIKELEELETKDRLAELEKMILDYYLAKGYKIGVGGWRFKVNISTYHKQKEIQIMFMKDFHSNYETVFRVSQKTTKEIFDKAFEYFSTK